MTTEHCRGSATILFTNGNPERPPGYPTAGLLNHFTFVTLFTQEFFFLMLKDNFTSSGNQNPQTGNLYISAAAQRLRMEERRKNAIASELVRHMVDTQHMAGREALEKE